LLAPASIQYLAFLSLIPPPTWSLSELSQVVNNNISATSNSRTWPSCQSLQCSLVVPWAEFYNMATRKVMLFINLCEFPGALSVSREEVGFVGCSSAREGVHLATKLVLRVSGDLSESVPPTICLTCPLWRSMQGLNRLLRGADMELDWQVHNGNRDKITGNCNRSERRSPNRRAVGRGSNFTVHKIRFRTQMWKRRFGHRSARRPSR
jgi:hypothetical protein